MPLSPASSAFHVLSMSGPSAVVASTAVTTTFGYPLPVDGPP